MLNMMPVGRTGLSRNFEKIVFGRALWTERPAAALHPVYRPNASPASRRRLAQCHNVHENNSAPWAVESNERTSKAVHCA
jgi:hypothetical protein